MKNSKELEMEFDHILNLYTYDPNETVYDRNPQVYLSDKPVVILNTLKPEEFSISKQTINILNYISGSVESNKQDFPQNYKKETVFQEEIENIFNSYYKDI